MGLAEVGDLQGLPTADIRGGHRSWGLTKGSLQCLAKKAGLDGLGLSESLKIYEGSRNALNGIRNHKRGEKINGFTGGRNTRIWV